MNDHKTKQLFDMVSDAERCAIAYEDVGNLLQLLDEQLFKATHGIDPAQPWTVKAFQGRLPIVQSLLSVILLKAGNTQKALDACVAGLYEIHSVSRHLENQANSQTFGNLTERTGDTP